MFQKMTHHQTQGDLEKGLKNTRNIETGTPEISRTTKSAPKASFDEGSSPINAPGQEEVVAAAQVEKQEERERCVD
jgi:hypothetical protein